MNTKQQIDKVDDWKNRIVGSGIVAAGELVANPLNARTHPQFQERAMQGALDEIGWIQDVIVNQRSGRLIDGHLRLALALQRGVDTQIPVKYVDLDDNEERLALLTLDPLSALAEVDNDRMSVLLDGIRCNEQSVLDFINAVGTSVEVWDNTSTDRAGQGVSSTWNQVQTSERIAIHIGDVESFLSQDVFELLKRTLESRFSEFAVPFSETIEAIVVAGVRAVENCGD